MVHLSILYCVRITLRRTALYSKAGVHFKSDEVGIPTQPNFLSLVQCERYLQGQLVYLQPVLGLTIQLARIYLPVEASSWHFLPLVQAQNDTGATSNSAETDVSETL